MIITTLTGGIGNQMFQYAVGKKLAKINNTELVLDISFFPYFNFQIIKRIPIYHMILKHFIPSFIVNKVVKEVGLRNYSLDNFNIKYKYKTKHPVELNKFDERYEHEYSDEVFKLKNNTHISGYWECAEYVDDIMNELREDFTPKKLFDCPVNTLCNSVALHVRRGDLLNPYEYKSPCDYEFYIQAIRFMEENVTTPVFYVFSDDIEWCKENLVFNSPVMFVSGYKNYQDLYSMSQCKHHIIANSTFSWWAANLGKHPKQIVVAPKTWFKTSYPDQLVSNSWNFF